MLIRVTRPLCLPDPVRLSLYSRSPDLGPRILFFSGGTALRNACAELIRYSYNTIHIITPFDSGGSSAKLRDAFHMLAIGDVRNRLLSLADRSLHGNPQVFRLFAHRFPEEAEQKVLCSELDRMINGRHHLVGGVPDPLRKIIRHHLFLFKKHMPESFDLGKASIGNLILTGGYLDNGRHPDSVIYIFSKLVQVRGIVRPLINRDLHLVSELEDGTRLIGQHLLTGKEVSAITSPVAKVYLSGSRKKAAPIKVNIRKKIKDLIKSADMICYPMGSFYSSIMANLLPGGVGKAVAENPCPKVFIPNTAPDPEMVGLSLEESIDRLTAQLRGEAPESISPEDVLNFVLVDRKNGNYRGEVDPARLHEMGIRLIDTPLISPETAPFIDEKLLVPVLFSLA